jgi:hypothetical protein
MKKILVTLFLLIYSANLFADTHTNIAQSFANIPGTLSCSQMPALTGDTVSSSASCATTNVGLNGINLSTLATGLLKNTTGTGAPTIAVSGTDYVSNLTGPITSIGNATSVAAQTGTGSTFVMNTAPQINTIGIGSAVRTDSLEYVHGIPSSAGVSVQGVFSAPVGATTATSSVSSFISSASSAAASYTLNSLIGYYASANTLGSGSTVTNSVGISIQDQTIGTNNFGITSAVSSGSGKWNIYSSGTAQNAFAGNTSFGGTSPPSDPVDVTGNMGVTGHISMSTGNTPTIASAACGALTNGTITGTDQEGKITIGAATTTTCAVTFGSSTWPSAPTGCTFSPASAASAALTVLPYISAVSSSGFTLSGSVLASTSFYYHCQ